MDFASCHILRKIQTKLTSQDTTAVIKYQCKVDMKHQTTLTLQNTIALIKYQFIVDVRHPTKHLFYKLLSFDVFETQSDEMT